MAAMIWLRLLTMPASLDHLLLVGRLDDLIGRAFGQGLAGSRASGRRSSGFRPGSGT